MGRAYIPVEVDRRVRAAARNRCGYCLSPQHLVMARLEIEHILPLTKGGNDDDTNLWLACPLCNSHKSDKQVGPLWTVEEYLLLERYSTVKHEYHGGYGYALA